MATKTTKITFDEGAAPATPGAGDVEVYAKADGLIYSKDDAGAESGPFGGSGVADIVDIPTAEMDDTLRLGPDGAGGVEWAAAGGGSGAAVGCIAYNNTTQVLSANAKIALNAEDWDPDGFHDPASNNSRLLVPAGLGGVYLAVGFIYRGTSDTPELFFIVDNTTRVRGSYRAMAFGGGPTAIVQLSAGSYIEMQTPSSTATVGHGTDRDKMNSLQLIRIGT